MKAPIGIVAAMRDELAPLRRRLADLEIATSVTGDGAARAALGASRFLDRQRPGTLLGVGVAGGLTLAAGRGELIVAERLICGDERFEIEASPLSERLLDAGARRGVIVHSPHIVATAEAKRRLAEAAGIDPGEAAIVDLESDAWLRAARTRGTPMTIARRVLDPCDESLPVDLARFQAPGGAVRRGAIARWLLWRPRKASALIRLGRRVREAGESIAEQLEPAIRDVVR